jgi:hypothetical protein
MNQPPAAVHFGPNLSTSQPTTGPSMAPSSRPRAPVTLINVALHWNSFAIAPTMTLQE